MDKKTQLDLEDDVAHVKLGGKWRIPTKSEFDELIANCTFSWPTQNGVVGLKVTGPNGASIFLPAAGCMYLNGLFREEYCIYSTSSLISGQGYAEWSFSCPKYNSTYWVDIERFAGMTIRAVQE